jgi:hypothetical protein
MAKKVKVIDQLHPEYNTMKDNWEKYRLTYDGGKEYIDKYLYQHDREDVMDYNIRRKLTYNPAFAKEAIMEIANSILQRLTEVTRTSPGGTYKTVCEGSLSGVDLNGSSMSVFIAKQVIPELLFMGTVGVYIDSPAIDPNLTLADTKDKHPYVYTYTVENILNWTYDRGKLTSVLLKEKYGIKNEETNLVTAFEDRYRFLKLTEQGVEVYFYNEKGIQIDLDSEPTSSPYILQLDIIPFVMLSIGKSLLTDVADYQITLLNVVSADIWYIHKGHAPFFVYQYDIKNVFDKLFGHKSEGLSDEEKTYEGNVLDQDEESDSILVGANRGLKIPNTVEFPRFVSPPSDSLKISMEKQEQMKMELRELVHLNLSFVQKKMASAESKQEDNRGLEAGLSSIGCILEQAENQIGKIWNRYEKVKEDPQVKYPEKYDLKSDKDRREDARDLDLLKVKIPSKTAQLEISKQVAEILLAHRTPIEVMDIIKTEIEGALGTTSDPEAIAQDIEKGLVSLETGSILRGYSKEESAKAEQDHWRRLVRIKEAQTVGMENPGARGLDDLDENPSESAKKEKEISRDTTQDDVPTDKTRGEGQ